MTRVNENARLEVMRLLAQLEDLGRDHEHWPEFTPLFECEADEGGGWENDREDIILAVQEAVKLGHMEAHALHESTDRLNQIMANLRGGREWMVKLTPAGYAWIRAHDAIGEARHEALGAKS